MALIVRPTTWLHLSRLISVLICLCTLALLPLPQLGVLMWAESTEAECPGQENRESSEEKLVVRFAACVRLKDRCHSDHSRPHKTGDRLQPITSCTGRLTAIVGHQLANGLCLPLLI
ncbi:MAG: hypothetical protein ABGX16_17020 [Pirellulales bacterium]